MCRLQTLLWLFDSPRFCLNWRPMFLDNSTFKSSPLSPIALGCIFTTGIVGKMKPLICLLWTRAFFFNHFWSWLVTRGNKEFRSRMGGLERLMTPKNENLYHALLLF